MHFGVHAAPRALMSLCALVVEATRRLDGRVMSGITLLLGSISQGAPFGRCECDAYQLRLVFGTAGVSERGASAECLNLPLHDNEGDDL